VLGRVDLETPKLQMLESGDTLSFKQLIIS